MSKGLFLITRRLNSSFINLLSSLGISRISNRFFQGKNLPESKNKIAMKGYPRNTELLIVFYNRMFSVSLDLDNHQLPGVHFSEDQTLLPVADVVVVHTPQVTQRQFFLRPKPPGQLWVSWSVESDINYPSINDQVYDLKMTYQKDADIWIPYCRNYGSRLDKKITQAPLAKEEACFIASFISSIDNQSKRFEYLKELSQHVDIHHYGRFMKNRTIEDDVGGKSKMEILGRYKFAIAFENSITPDYVTEKYYDPLLVGTIPIYLGAPNISEYTPGKNCHINVNDFTGPADLAEYLQKLNKDDSLLERHLKWRKEPLRKDFIDQVQSFEKLPHSFIQLAELVKQMSWNIDGFVPHKKKSWKLKASKDVASLINKQSGNAVNLDGTSWLIWELCNNRRTITQIQDTLIAAYPNKTKQIRQDVIRTLRILWHHGAIEMTKIE